MLGEDEGERLIDGEEEIEADRLALIEADREADMEAEAEIEAETEADKDALIEAEILGDMEAEIEALTVADNEELTEGEILADNDADAEADNEAETDAEAETLADNEADILCDWLGEAETEALIEALADTDADIEADGDAEIEADTDAEALILAETDELGALSDCIAIVTAIHCSEAVNANAAVPVAPAVALFSQAAPPEGPSKRASTVINVVPEGSPLSTVISSSSAANILRIRQSSFVVVTVGQVGVELESSAIAPILITLLLSCPVIRMIKPYVLDELLSTKV